MMLTDSGIMVTFTATQILKIAYVIRVTERRITALPILISLFDTSKVDFSIRSPITPLYTKSLDHSP
jgi:hypothetical protein